MAGALENVSMSVSDILSGAKDDFTTQFNYKLRDKIINCINPIPQEKTKRDLETKLIGFIANSTTDELHDGHKKYNVQELKNKVKELAEAEGITFQNLDIEQLIKDIPSVSKNLEYNTGYYLEEQQVHAAALIYLSHSISQSPTEVAKTYPIQYSTDNMYNIISEGNKVKQTKIPYFFIIVDQAHIVTLALIPDVEQSNGLSLVYINSYGKTEIEGCSPAGYESAENLAQRLGITVQDLSYDHQYNSCCGLSTALNIAKIASHFKHGGDLKGLKKEFEAFDQTIDQNPIKNKYLKNLYSILGSIMVNAVTGDLLFDSLDQKVDLSMYENNSNEVEILTNALGSHTEDAPTANNNVDDLSDLGAAASVPNAPTSSAESQDSKETILEKINKIHDEDKKLILCNTLGCDNLTTLKSANFVPDFTMISLFNEIYNEAIKNQEAAKSIPLVQNIPSAQPDASQTAPVPSLQTDNNNIEVIKRIIKNAEGDEAETMCEIFGSNHAEVLKQINNNNFAPDANAISLFMSIYVADVNNPTQEATSQPSTSAAVNKSDTTKVTASTSTPVHAQVNIKNFTQLKVDKNFKEIHDAQANALTTLNKIYNYAELDVGELLGSACLYNETIIKASIEKYGNIKIYQKNQADGSKHTITIHYFKKPEDQPKISREKQQCDLFLYNQVNSKLDDGLNKLKANKLAVSEQRLSKVVDASYCNVLEITYNKQHKGFENLTHYFVPAGCENFGEGFLNSLLGSVPDLH